MYARYFRFRSTPDQRQAIESLADDVHGLFKSQKGFVSVTFVISQEQSEYGSFSLWASRDDAEASGEVVRQATMSRLGEIATAPPEVAIMEVYESAAG